MNTYPSPRMRAILSLFENRKHYHMLQIMGESSMVKMTCLSVAGKRTPV